MPRALAFALEPSDVLLALLRIRAAMEAGRWPTGISTRFRTATDREFSLIEPCVRTIGVCYSELEDRGVASLDREPQSRFSDIDGALHLAACSIDVALDLDPLRMAVARGDRTVRETASRLAQALRQLLWYAVHSDMLVCSRMVFNDADLAPERALEFVDAYLEGAWRPGAPPEPPSPIRETATDEHEPIAARPSERTGLPFVEPTAVFRPQASNSFVDLLAETGGEERTLGTDHTRPSGMLPPDVRALLSNARTVSAYPDAFFETSSDQTATAPRRSILENVVTEARAAATLDALSDDAMYFLEVSGAPWPCDPERLHAARAALMSRAAKAEGTDGRAMRGWIDRAERGYAELRRLVSR